MERSRVIVGDFVIDAEIGENGNLVISVEEINSYVNNGDGKVVDIIVNKDLTNVLASTNRV